MARRNEHLQIAKLAEECLAELEGNILEVVLIPSNDPECAMRGGMIRAVQNQNCSWYRSFCEAHPSNRKWQNKKGRTLIKRQWTRRGLNELIDGKCHTTYAQRAEEIYPRMAQRERMIRITPQFYKSRTMTYAIYFNEIFCGYARCFCKANKAAEILLMSLR
jgi:hypothetical protein